MPQVNPDDPMSGMYLLQFQRLEVSSQVRNPWQDLFLNLEMVTSCSHDASSVCVSGIPPSPHTKDINQKNPTGLTGNSSQVTAFATELKISSHSEIVIVRSSTQTEERSITGKHMSNPNIQMCKYMISVCMHICMCVRVCMCNLSDKKLSLNRRYIN